MSYIALYRKYRPLTFDDVVEQDYVKKTLKNAVSLNRVGHAYLFCGTRGTGKTSFAKILARAVNCKDLKDGNPCNVCSSCKGILSSSNLDVLEIDAASNNGVDSIREIREEVYYKPQESKYKVYIIDEVHMLSTGAFNALLKTLEEPPPHVIFILATTEVHKIPATILSRCQRFDFRRISVSAIAKQLMYIADQNDLGLDERSAKYIANIAEGGLRDAISILDQCLNSSVEVNLEQIMDITGMVGTKIVREAADSIIQKDVTKVLLMIDKLVLNGKGLRNFAYELTTYFRDLLVLKLTDDVDKMTFPLYENIDRIKQTVQDLDEAFLIAMIKELASLEQSLRWVSSARVTLEVGMIKLCNRRFVEDFDGLSARIIELEKQIESKEFVKEVKKVEVKDKAENIDAKKSNKTVQKKKPKEAKNNVKQEKLEKVDCWQKVIDEIKSMGRMTLFSNVLDSEAFFKDDDLVIISPENSFHALTISRAENIEIIEGILENNLGRTVSVRVDTNMRGNSSKSDESDSLVKRTQEFAKKADIPFDIIDD